MSFFSSSKKKSILENISYGLILFLIVSLPLVVLPSFFITTLSIKIAFFTVILSSAVLFYALSIIRSQYISLPKTKVLLGLWALPFVYVVGTLFSTNSAVQFFGERLMMDTALFITVLVAFSTLIALIIATVKRVFGIYTALFLGSILFLCVQIPLFFFPFFAGFLSSVTLLGTLTDFALFLGLFIGSIILALFMLPLTPFLRFSVLGLLFVSLFFLSVIYIPIIWGALSLFSLGIILWHFTIKRKSKSSSFPLSAFFVFFLSVLFLFVGQTLSHTLSHSLVPIGEYDVRPSSQAMMVVGEQALQENFLFGVGPGRFSEAWALYMPTPPRLQNEVFWDIDFLYGTGFIPTTLITTGFLGFIAWLIFFSLFIGSGIRFFFYQIKEQEQKNPFLLFVVLHSFLSALYVLLMSFFTVPSPVIFAYGFLFIGVYISARFLLMQKESNYFSFTFEEKPHLGFGLTFIASLCIIAILFGIYGTSTRVYADILYRQSVEKIQNEENLDDAEKLIQKALSFYPSDVYYRTLSTIDFTRLQVLISSLGEEEEGEDAMRMILSRSIENAKNATEKDPRDYRNWMTLGSLYQNLVLLSIEGAKDQADIAFDRVLALRPHSPSVYLAKATLERNEGNTEDARKFVEKAITIRNNYTDAVFLLAQMQLEAGELEKVFNSLQAVTLFDPENYVAYFQLGVLHYGEGNFRDAKEAFLRALEINPLYANAHYFLGLTYWREGNFRDALQEMKEVLSTNPQNKDVLEHIADLNAGMPAPRNTAENDILERENLPIPESSIIEGSILDEMSGE
jgi:tetratricopeptide (TPR) repeat protein